MLECCKRDADRTPRRLLLLFVVLLLLRCTGDCTAQSFILLRNADLEGPPSTSRPPTGWFTCGNMASTPSDLLPSGAYGVRTAPHRGQRYVGMVVRRDGSGECLGQQLTTPLRSGTSYYLQIWLARAATYRGRSAVDGQAVNYTAPARLAIYGVAPQPGKQQRLAVSPPVEHTEWRRYDFHLKPSADYDQIRLRSIPIADQEAAAGNLLLDACSPLLRLHSGSLEDCVPLLKQTASVALGAELWSTVAADALSLQLYRDKMGALHHTHPLLHSIPGLRQKKKIAGLKFWIYATDRKSYQIYRQRLLRAVDPLLSSATKLKIRWWKGGGKNRDWISIPGKERIGIEQR